MIRWLPFAGTAWPEFSPDELETVPGFDPVAQWWVDSPGAPTPARLTLPGAPAWFANGSNVEIFSTPNPWQPWAAATLTGVKIKTADKVGTVVPYAFAAGLWSPQFAQARAQPWDSTGIDPEAWAVIGAAAAALVGGALGLGAAAETAAAPAASSPSSAGWVSGFDLVAEAAAPIAPASSSAGWVSGFDLVAEAAAGPASSIALGPGASAAGAYADAIAAGALTPGASLVAAAAPAASLPSLSNLAGSAAKVLGPVLSTAAKVIGSPSGSSSSSAPGQAAPIGQAAPASGSALPLILAAVAAALALKG